MKGTITQRSYDGRRWCIVRGEDDVEYFFSYKALINPKQYKHYSWIGNAVVFDKDESEEYYRPHAKNVILAEVRDPNRREKYLRKMEEQRIHLEKEEKKRTNRERQEILKARADRRREYEADNTWYTVEFRSGDEWKPVAFRDGYPIKVKTVSNAKREIEKLKIMFPDFSYRFTKSVGLAMTVHSKR